MRALILALTDWVTKNAAPPPSVYPLLAKGDLVQPEHRLKHAEESIVLR
jgi:hypothetical protein